MIIAISPLDVNIKTSYYGIFATHKTKTNIMKKFLFTLIVGLGLTQITKAQITTCLPCDQLDMSVNVSDTNYLNIYHAGQYLTNPQEFNVFAWEFTDQQGNIIFEDTIVDNAIVSFSHSFPITDTMNVTVYLRNDSAILPDGNIVNCLFEDQIYWEVGVFFNGTPWGRWEFLHGNVGADVTTTLGINNIEPLTASVYPNPSNDLVNISLKEGQILKIELFNMTGRLIFEQNLNSKTHTLNIGDYPSGVYQMRVFNQNNDIVSTTVLKK